MPGRLDFAQSQTAKPIGKMEADLQVRSLAGAQR